MVATERKQHQEELKAARAEGKALLEGEQALHADEVEAARVEATTLLENEQKRHAEDLAAARAKIKFSLAQRHAKELEAARAEAAAAARTQLETELMGKKFHVEVSVTLV